MHIEIYCDGSATTNDKPGGWAYVIALDGVKKSESSGFMQRATNNVAELQGAISGLSAIWDDEQLRSADEITLVSDSQLVLHFADGTWQCKKPHLIPYYCKLRQLYQKLNAKTRWVKGHSGDEHNERADQLAKAARIQQDSDGQTP